MVWGDRGFMGRGTTRGLTGDNEWTQVSVRVRVNRNATSIRFGGTFTGEGTVWFDNLELYINGRKY